MGQKEIDQPRKGEKPEIHKPMHLAMKDLQGENKTLSDKIDEQKAILDTLLTLIKEIHVNSIMNIPPK